MKTGQRTLRVAFTAARGAHVRDTDGYNNVVSHGKPNNKPTNLFIVKSC